MSGLDEAGFEASDPAGLTARLARAKAEAVAGSSGVEGALVLGCDSLLEVDGVVHGKPADASAAMEQWRRARGRRGLLHTGHHLIDTGSRLTGRALAGGGPAAPGDPRPGPGAHGAPAIGRVESTVVHFGRPTDAEIEAYVATGEPLGVAGAFTIDGRGGAFVEGIEGNPSNVVGLSIPLLRAMLSALGISYIDLWTPR